jgi:hypothetical protein
MGLAATGMTSKSNRALTTLSAERGHGSKCPDTLVI